MNHPFGACYSHFKEVADLADEFQRYKTRPTQNDNMQPMNLEPDSAGDMDVDGVFMEHDNLGGGVIGV